MVEHHPVGYRHKRLVWALAALDPRKIADPAHELVRTGRRIAGLPGLLAQKPRRKDVIAPPEESSKEPDLRCGRRWRWGDRCDWQGRVGQLLRREGCQLCP